MKTFIRFGNIPLIVISVIGLVLLTITTVQAQNSLFSVDDGLTLNCQNRISINNQPHTASNFAYLGNFRYEIHIIEATNDPAVFNSFEVELLGSFGASDLNNSSGGALIWKTGPFDPQNPRSGISGAMNVTGPGTFVITPPVSMQNSRIGTIHLALELSAEANTDELWFRNTIDQTSLNFTPSRSFSGVIPGISGVTDPKPILPEGLEISDGAGVINISWDPNGNEEHEFITDPFTTAELSHFAGEGENSIVLAGLVAGTKHTIDLVTRNNMPGCTITTLYPGNLASNIWVCPDRPEPPLAVNIDHLSSVFATISFEGNPANNPTGNVEHRFVVVMREAGSPRVIPEDGQVLRHFNSHLNPGQSPRYFGDYDIGNGNYNVTSTSNLDPNTTYEIDVYMMGRIDVPFSSVYRCAIYSSYITTSFTTCPSSPGQATNTTAGNITQTSANISWTSGSGEGRIVVLRDNSSDPPVNINLVQGTELQANSDFSSAPLYPGATNSRIVYNGPSTGTLQVTGLLPADSYTAYVYEYNGNGACRTYSGQGSTQNAVFSTMSNDLSVSTQPVTNRTATTAVGGGDISLINNVTVTEKGIVWSPSTNQPTIDISTKATAGAGSGSFTATMTSLTAGTDYYMRAYAIADGNVFYGNSRLFYTLASEPANHVTNFMLDDLTPVTNSLTAASFSWDAAPNTAGYVLVYRRDGNAPGTAGMEDGINAEEWELPSGTFWTDIIQQTSITMNLSANLPHDFVIIPVRYNAEVPNTVNYKIDGTLPALSFVTDTEAPQISVFSPAHNEQNVATGSTLSMQFSEPVVKGTGNVEIVNGNTTDVIKTIAIAGSDVTVNGQVVTIDPDGLPGTTPIYLNIPAGGFEDLNGNIMSAFSGKNTWRFTTNQPDVTPPNLIRLTPDNSADDLPVSSNLRLDFDENVRAGSGNITIKRQSNNNNIQVIPVDGNAVEVIQGTVTITPDVFPGETGLYVTIDDGAIEDLSGNDYSGFTNPSTWAFTTDEAPDVTPPALSELTPAEDQVNVPLNAALRIRFDEPVVKGSGFITIKLVADGTTREIVNVSSSAVTISNTTATILPGNDLPGSEQLYIEVSSGAFEDQSGNVYAGFSGNSTWSFTTTAPPDGNQPQLLANSLNPASGVGHVQFDADLSFSFNENVLKGTGDILVKRFNDDETVASIDVTTAQVSINNEQVTIDPMGDLPEGLFYVEIPSTAFKDASDNFYPGLLDKSWTFITISAPPMATTLDPMDESTGIALSSTFTINFDEEVDAGSTGFFNLRRLDNNAIVVSIQPEENRVTYNGQQVMIDVDLPASLYGVALYARIDPGFVNDLSGNPFGGINNNSTWNFTVKMQPDVTGPVLIGNSFSPADDAIAVDPETDLVFSFDEPVLEGNGDVILKNYVTDAVVEIINIPNGDFTIVNDQVTVNPVEALGEGQFYIEISNGAFLDAFDNHFSGLNDKDAWNFATQGTPPAPQQYAPVIGSTNVPVTGTAVVTFDEPITLGSSGSIFIRRADNNANLQTIPRNDPAVTINGSTLSVDYDISGFESTGVYIQVQTGSIEDLNGNVLIALNGNTWNFTTAAAPDVSAPVILGGSGGLFPADGATLVAPETNLELTFNEDVQGGPGIITFHRFSDDQVLQGILASDPAVSFSGNVVTVDPPVELADVQMYILISEDAIQDLSGNYYAGISDKNGWNFYPEIVRPTFVSMDPENGAAGIATGEPVTFTMLFSENIQLGSGGTQWIRVLRADNNAQLYNVPLDDPSLIITGSQLSFDIEIPESETFSETDFYIHIGSATIEDLNGNTLTGNVGLASLTGFTTELVDLTPPVLELFNGSRVPADNAFNIPYNTDLSFEFREAVIKGTGSINIRDVNDGGAIVQAIDVHSAAVNIQDNVVTIDPPQDLPEANLYIEVEPGTFVDLQGNDFNENNGSIVWSTQWNFTTFIVPLVAVSFTPPNGASNVQINEPVQFEVTFSQDIAPNTLPSAGDILVRFGSGIVLTIPHDDPAVNLSGNKLTFSFTIPGASVYFGKTLSVQLQNGVVQDLNGLSKSTQVPSGSWNFTMEAATPPEIISRSPMDDAINVTINTDIIATFDENITKSTQFYARLSSSSNNNIEEFDDEHSGVTISGNQLTIDPTDDLVEGETYWITLNGNSVLDAEGSGNSGISGNTAWNFSVGDAEAPVLQGITPEDNASEVALDTDFTLMFDEPVFAGNAGSLMIRLSNNVLFESIPIPDARVTGLGTNTLTFNPDNTLGTNQAYYVTLAAGVLEDAIGNAYTGITGNTEWNFTTSTADIVNPTLVSLSPEDDEDEVGTNINLVMVFNEPVQWGTGSIVLKEFSSENTVEIFNSGSGNQTVNGNNITLEPTGNLASTTQYYVEVAADAVEDVSENPYAGFTGKTSWNFTTLNTDVTPPDITGFSPADDVTTVPEAIGELVITYDEPVVGISGAYDLRIVGSSSSTKVFTVGSSDVEVTGNTVTLKNVPQLTPHQDYYVRNVAVVEDLAGNAAETWNTSQTRWNFSTFSDLTAPSLVSQLPLDNAINVDAGTGIILEFSEPIIPNGFVVAIRRYDNNSLVKSLFNGASELTLDENVITIDLDDDLDRFTQYYVTTTNIMDLATNPFPDITDKDEWNFIVDVLDDESPTISTVTPPDGATNIPTNIGSFAMTFSEPVFPVAGQAIRLRRVGGNQIVQEFFVDTEDVTINGNELTLNEVDQLGTNVSYWMQGLSVLTDEAGNPLSGWANNETTWSFTTEIRPDIVTYSPAKSSAGNSHETDIVLTFNKVVVPGSGFIKVFRSSNDEELLSIEVNSPEVSFSDEVVTISPFTPLPDENISVYVTIDGTAFTDENGNDYFGFNNSFSYVFQLQSTDVTGPSIVAVTPADNMTDVPVDTNFTIEFDEDVSLGNSSFLVKFYNAGTTAQNISYASGNVSANGNTITIDPPNDLQVETHYWIQVNANTIFDGVGNGNEGIVLANRDDWDFTTVAPPELDAFTPMNNATGVDPASDLVMVFDELVVKGSGFIRIIDDSDGSELSAIDVTSSDIGIADGVVTVSNALPDANLEVRINIDAGAFEDVNGQPYDGLSSNSAWTFTIQSTDVVAPFIVNVSPADDAMEVPGNANLVIEYNEDIFLGNSSFLIKFYDGNSGHKTINYASGEVTVDGNTITIDPSSDLALAQHFWVQINPGTITDFAGNGNAGIVLANKDDWDFFTEVPDLTPPSIDNLTPEDDATGVSTTNWAFTVEFDEPVFKGGGNARIRVYNGDGITAIANLNDHITVTGNSATIDFNALGNLDASHLNFETRFYIEIENGLFEDETGNAYIGHTKDDWDFTTEEQDITEPSATSRTPADDATNVAPDQDIVITFDEDIMLGVNGATKWMIINDHTGTFEIVDLTTSSATISGNTLTATHMDFIPGTSYSIFLGDGVIADLSNNWFEGYNTASAWNFTVGKYDQNITFNALETRTFGDDNFILTATASSALTVEYTSSDPSVASVSGNEVTILNAGTTTITALQPGDENHNAAVEVMQLLSVNKADQIITIQQIDDKLTTDAAFMASASVGSGLPLTYEVSGPATISGQEITLTGEVGSVTLTVTQDGNENYNAASAQESFSVSEPIADVVNSIPTAISLSASQIAENLSANTVIGTLSTEDADSGDEHVYSLVEGDGDNDNDSFTIEGDELLSAESFDFEEQPEYTIRVASDDGNGGVIEANFVITVTDEDDITVTGLDDDWKPNLQFYPNPARDYVKVSLDQLQAGKVEIKLLNLRGESIRSTITSDEELEIDLIGLKPGVYIIKVIENNRFTTTRLIVGG